MARLKQFYNEEVVKEMTKQFGYTSVMEVPKSKNHTKYGCW